MAKDCLQTKRSPKEGAGGAGGAGGGGVGVGVGGGGGGDGSGGGGGGECSLILDVRRTHLRNDGTEEDEEKEDDIVVVVVVVDEYDNDNDDDYRALADPYVSEPNVKRSLARTLDCKITKKKKKKKKKKKQQRWLCASATPLDDEAKEETPREKEVAKDEEQEEEEEEEEQRAEGEEEETPVQRQENDRRKRRTFRYRSPPHNQNRATQKSQALQPTNHDISDIVPVFATPLRPATIMTSAASRTGTYEGSPRKNDRKQTGRAASHRGKTALEVRRTLKMEREK
ncbi:hypothetical protein EAI_03894 [Harpegnathos saltator]|uniref:Uncharacterized protein n=1 Tax=Harpegnathos saltator TaxID=610380 RepID=E2C7L6_HARSA|nr:hypothetical protein EAI_03894 [Harpegnathos saltator]